MHDILNNRNFQPLTTDTSNNYPDKVSVPIAAELKPAQRLDWVIAGVLLGLSPVISFLAQYLLSLRVGTQYILFRHLTVMVVDWIFVPFNFFVVRVIDWGRGGRLYVILCVSVILNALTHAFWQYNGLDLGHMITKAGVVLPAGWVHLSFSTLEMVLLAAFVFCRRHRSPQLQITTFLATIYFITMGICGYAMHHAFIASDVVVTVSGLFFVLIYPKLAGQEP